VSSPKKCKASTASRAEQANNVDRGKSVKIKVSQSFGQAYKQMFMD